MYIRLFSPRVVENNRPATVLKTCPCVCHCRRRLYTPSQQNPTERSRSEWPFFILREKQKSREARATMWILYCKRNNYNVHAATDFRVDAVDSSLSRGIFDRPCTEKTILKGSIYGNGGPATQSHRIPSYYHQHSLYIIIIIIIICGLTVRIQILYLYDTAAIDK